MTTLQFLALGCGVALVSIWVVYPALMAMLGRVLRPGPRETGPGDWPVVSIIIATRDDAATIRERVEDCLAVDYPAARLEVVVAIDAGGPQAWQYTADPRVRVVPGDAPGGKALTLNAGVRAARGEVLVFTDARQRFAPDAVRWLVRALDDPVRGAVSGRLELLAGDSSEGLLSRLYWRMERVLRRNEARVHSTVGVTGAVYAMRARLWQDLPGSLILDDLYTPMRLALQGHRIGFEDRARAIETRGVRLDSEYQRKVRTLTGNLQMCAWMPLVLSPIHNPIWLQFLFHKLFRLATPYLTSVLLLYGLVAGGLWAAAHRTVMAVLIMAAILVAFAFRFPAVRLARQLLAFGMMMQWAVVVATVNGARRRWNVWD